MSEFKIAAEIAKKQTTEDDALRVSLDSALDGDYDSVTMLKKSKGGTKYALNNITATTTSSELVIEGYNSIIIFCYLTGSSVWELELSQATVTEDTFIPVYENGTKFSIKTINTSMSQSISGLADYLKVTAKKISGDGSITVKVKPFNM